MSSPLLLVGKEGVGKKFSVLEAIKDFFCKGDGNDEFHTRQVDHGTHPDLLLVSREPDADEIKIEAIRDLVRNIDEHPTYGKLRFIVIDGADHLNTASANALLKTLEEPPAFVRFFLLAESERGVLPTIRSRCGKVRYRALPEAFILARILTEQSEAQDATKALVFARLAEGSVGRAIGYWGSGRLRLRDQVLEFLKPELLDNPSYLFRAVDSVEAELALGLRFLEHIIHDILMIAVDPARLTNVDIEPRIRALRESLGQDRAVKILHRLRGVQRHLDRGTRIVLLTHVKSALVGVGG